MAHIIPPPIVAPTAGALDFFIDQALRHRPQAGKLRGSKLVLSSMIRLQRWTAPTSGKTTTRARTGSLLRSLEWVQLIRREAPAEPAQAHDGRISIG
jgi:hypothetical protein